MSNKDNKSPVSALLNRRFGIDPQGDCDTTIPGQLSVSLPLEEKKTDVKGRELKSRHVQLLMRPSFHAEVKAAADAAGVSFNDYVETALRCYIEK